MKTLITVFQVIGRSCFFALMLFVAFSLGCRSQGTQPVNPFAMDRQTIPAPATYSYQQSILGQQSSSYQPAAPASTYPGSTTPPLSSPAPITYPQDLPPSTGMTPYSSTVPIVTDSLIVSTIPISEVTSQTVAENLDNRAGISAVVSSNGQTGYTYLGQAPISVSSSQFVTTVSERTP